MRARARKAASSAAASPYSSTSSLSSDEMSVPIVSLPYLPTPCRHSRESDVKDKDGFDKSGMQPFPSSSPLATPRLGPSKSRSPHPSIKSQAPRPSRSKSSRLAESLTRSSSKTSKSTAQISSTMTADLLTKHLAPLPRFDPFEKRRRSESLSAIVRRDAGKGGENQKGDGPASAAACRKMSSWSCLRAARKSDGCAPSIHLLAL
ncbi:hypothetical protein BDY19DRAFT_14065 [Irpex rosettiformis]|uniref:Uncharacterized protein n=1 Tax=Irpex rosettiformis TaxID=378272 RepID=A0ACB8UJ13_9APHY|nr:hypothetical protein BDY19DRAFT_14065 [Irpex rosettiformis]